MNEGFNRLLKYDFSGLGCWLTIIAFVLIASSVGLGWIVNGFVILIFLSLLAPIVIWGVAKWWLKSNFVQAQCPVCEYEFTGFKNTEFQCPSCNEPLQYAKEGSLGLLLQEPLMLMQRKFLYSRLKISKIKSIF